MLQADCERFRNHSAPPELTILVFVKVPVFIQLNLTGLPPGGHQMRQMTKNQKSALAPSSDGVERIDGDFKTRN